MVLLGLTVRVCLGECKLILMKALILDGSKEGDAVLKMAHDILKEKLTSAGWEVNSFILRDTKIAPCMGCFDCWLKTPGVCTINDAGRETTKTAAQSDLWVFLTPITFGGYSSELKKAVDRMPPVLVPVFVKANDEVHHKPRFSRHPNLVAFALLSNMDSEYKSIFKNFLHRNALNFCSPSDTSEFLLPDEDTEKINSKVVDVLSKIGVIK